VVSDEYRPVRVREDDLSQLVVFVFSLWVQLSIGALVLPFCPQFSQVKFLSGRILQLHLFFIRVILSHLDFGVDLFMFFKQKIQHCVIDILNLALWRLQLYGFNELATTL
jgi:hypothetical protein